MKISSIDSFDVKTVDGLLYGWGEWRLRKADLNGYSAKTLTALLMDGAMGFGRSVMKSMIPVGIMFESEGRAEIYQLIEGFCETLGDKHKAVLIAYYSVCTKSTCTDEERARKLGISPETARKCRLAVRDMALIYLRSRVLVA